MTAPTVSVVMIFWNAERFMAEAIDSVLAQTFQDWELLLVDDGSSDSSSDLARGYVDRHPGRIRRLEHPGHQNRGMSPSRNLGMSQARGRLIALLDADDRWLPHKLERQVALLDAHPEASLVFGAAQYWQGWTGKPADLASDQVPALGIPADRVYRAPALASLVYPLANGTAPCPSDLMFRKCLIDRIGGFEESFSGPNQLYEDQGFLAKVYLHDAVYVSGETWTQYRNHPDSCSSAAARDGRYRAVRRFFLDWYLRYLQRVGVADPAIRSAVERATRMLDSQWSLRLGEGAMAAMVTQPGSSDSIQVTIADPPPRRGYDVQLNRPRLTIEAGRRYGLRFSARADASRRIAAGVAQAHEPWQGLGCYLEVDVGDEWRSFEQEFEATASDDNARIHFDLGSSTIAVQVAGATLRRMPGGEIVEPAEAGADPSTLLGDLRRLTPVSRQWGFDRGTPIDRHYIETFLAREGQWIRGRVLEIEDDYYTRRFGSDRVTGRDVLHVEAGNPRATIVGDLTRADHIPDESFDCIVLTQTLQLIYDTRAALATLERILKPGGTLLATFPGLSPVSHREWAGRWYWGFTTASSRRLFEEAFGPGAATVEAFGNVLTSIGFLHGLAREELRPDELAHHDPDYELLIAVRATRTRPSRGSG